MEMLQNALNGIDSVSSYVLVAVLIPTGLYFTIRTGVIQVRMLPEMFRTLAEPGGRDSEGNKNISPFRAFSISAASRVGTANIAGVALAISLGGPGAVFWMWLTAVVGGATAFAESALGQVYKMKDGPNFRGGPAYYIRHGMNMKWLGLVFAVIVAITYGIVFNTVQSNSIVDAVGASFNVEDSNFAFSAIAGVVIAVGAYLIFVGGAKRISNISAYLVPIMAGLYLIVGIIVVVLNLGAVPDMILTIFTDAFSMDSIAGGTLGSIMLIGVQRGLFSNEAGIGSVPNAAATASASHPAKQGFVQALGVYFDTILVCSITAFIILLSNPEYGSSAEGIQLTQTALSGQLGQWAIHFLTFAIFLFAFSSILGNYYYGEANIEHLTTSKVAMRVYQVIVMVSVFIGAIAALDIVWTAANIFMAIMALINLFALLMLSPLVFNLLKNYQQQRRQGLEPVFHRSDLPTFKRINTDIDAWDGTDEVTTAKFWQDRGKKVRPDDE
ncbi:MAG: alanine/glycine:cation symporter family protein [Brevibacterium aurantiacum]|uniref:Alanine or glycine:cation symporter, AGCS family n=1 Tax=Brevibacterium aurantiacum TaxID=273384 RepID=A0A2A3YXQ3_BREAU|nr:alanine/glycine:cation symporter family protein [Brevibacterium aurantiacum]MDN5608581.1 alanine:cation symporter family protein [Brevibacterium sp.]AZT92138.1 alanine:cation symporter family protein [Brevibacterium aurantiacum]MDN5712357.1 alanine:cation symporter family protein [Brevibacterium aurantiacum]MDN5792598.1 alanine:cation symporter family protein [Brevibacterium aurantiacum]MDN6377748.1 alanine:cation symporter family protein [Brevibacterium aurantiacum]